MALAEQNGSEHKKVGGVSGRDCTILFDMVAFPPKPGEVDI